MHDVEVYHSIFCGGACPAAQIPQSLPPLQQNKQEWEKKIQARPKSKLMQRKHHCPEKAKQPLTLPDMHKPLTLLFIWCNTLGITQQMRAGQLVLLKNSDFQYRRLTPFAPSHKNLYTQAQEDLTPLTLSTSKSLLGIFDTLSSQH